MFAPALATGTAPSVLSTGDALRVDASFEFEEASPVRSVIEGCDEARDEDVGESVGHGTTPNSVSRGASRTVWDGNSGESSI